jgi:hypothetical protein
MVWTEAIKAEWDRHQSKFTAQWLLTMMNLTKLRPAKDELLEKMREAIAEHSTDENVARIMLKDVHLVEAALSTDWRVVSLDEAARGHFRQLAANFHPLQPIIWVNPALEDEQAVDWLERGAPKERSRRLKR